MNTKWRLRLLKIETFNKIQEKNNILAFFPIFIPILIEQFFQTLIGNVDTQMMELQQLALQIK